MTLPEFKNQPLTDFGQDSNRTAMLEALGRVRSQLGREYDLVIEGQRIRCDSKFQSINPSRSSEVIGIFQKGTQDLVEESVAVAERAFRSWSQTPVQERVRPLICLSELMQERRFELVAWLILEVGKSWQEADAEVAEAIDFCEYYCRQMLELGGRQELVPWPGETNELRYIPLGVGAVIPPWNFPLAILAGMTLAAVVAGNTTIVKPSSDSPAIGYQFMQLIEEAGLPPGVVNFLSGSGSEIGDPLVQHPRVRFIAFTGSKEVGLRINRFAAQPQPGQIWIKRVVAEMGGKDSIIIDDGVSLQEAAQDVLVSAFGFQGQKCSACSRVIVLDSVYEDFLEELVQTAITGLVEGSVEDPETNFGPVINRSAQLSIQDYIESGKREGRLVMGGDSKSNDGFFIRPTIFADVDPRAIIALEEIFGPVLAVIRAADFQQALRIANNTEYGLTGAVYSGNPDHLEQARREFHVGNLYLNRKCTGALVGVHPFGGFNMSGTDSKAGGPDYLLLFTQAKTIAAKI